ncbi:PHP domain-containing protein [Salinicoccus hispanicus]|uniref:PHP domain-containing protein n=1 Tax=Salinicoccus hispanicus TaxID=157225 RepID=A0A6N8TYJ5_9STAP|nr:PHP domain-containing protein [Salinicoccus hispanicus]MXQ51068.1 PHP domain-containing protein [Salinicoccus hispanicus]
MKIDLHVHSSLSDGSDSLEKVLDRAADNGVETLSFVDHDMTETYTRALPYAEQLGIALIPGIEISAYDFKRDRKVHVLGYNYDLDALHISELCQPLLERRHAHSLWQIEQIRSAGFDVDVYRIQSRLEPGQSIYKQHIMADITSAHYDSHEYKALYRKLFKGQGPASGDIRYIDVHDVIEAVKLDCGQVVIAHPGQLNSYELIEEIAGQLDGVEQHHPDHDAEDIDRVARLCTKYRLFTTGGSDFHGDFGDSVNVGIDKHSLSVYPFD